MRDGESSRSCCGRSRRSWRRWSRAAPVRRAAGGSGRRRRLPKVVRKPQWEALLAAATRARDRVLIAVMLYGGLRVSEACALDVRDVDYEVEQVHVRHGKGDKEGH